MTSTSSVDYEVPSHRLSVLVLRTIFMNCFYRCYSELGTRYNLGSLTKLKLYQDGPSYLRSQDDISSKSQLQEWPICIWNIKLTSLDE